MSTTTPDEQRGQLDPVVAAPSETGWRRWLSDLATAEQERLAGFGLVVLLGFVLGAAAVYGFTWLAGEVLLQQTNQLDGDAAAFIRQWQSPVLDTVASTISLFGSEIVLALGVVLL